MREYKVIALSVGGKGNKIFKSGDLVNENQFPEGNAEQLVKGGFLEPIEEKKRVKKEDPPPPPPVDEQPVDEQPEEKAYEDLTKKEIITKLMAQGATFKPMQSKQELLDILLSL